MVYSVDGKLTQNSTPEHPLLSQKESGIASLYRVKQESLVYRQQLGC